MNEIGIYIINIMIGLIIGICIGIFAFKKTIYKGPDSNIISKNIYTDSDGKKYKWVPSVCICPINLSMGLLKEPNYVVPHH